MAILGAGNSASRLWVPFAVVIGIHYIRKLINTTTPPIQDDQDQRHSYPVEKERSAGDEDEDEVNGSKETARPKGPAPPIRPAPPIIPPGHEGPPRQNT